MKAYHFAKVIRFTLILACITASAGCNLPSMKVGVDDATRRVLEDAIDELGNWPGEWETTLTA